MRHAGVIRGYDAIALEILQGGYVVQGLIWSYGVIDLLLLEEH
jgi:hypothetical protein